MSGKGDAGRNEGRRLQSAETILSKAEQLVGMGSYEVNLRTREVFWSDELFRLYGYEPGEVEPSLELVNERVHPEDRARIRERTARVFDNENPIGGEFRIQLADGTVRHVITTGEIERDADGEPLSVVGAVQDVTEERMRERDLRAHHALTQALGEWDDFDEGVVDLLRRLSTAMEWQMAAMWVRSPQRASLLVSRAFWSDPAAGLASFEQRSREMTYERGVGAIWKVWEEQGPLNIVDLRSNGDVTQSVAREEAIDIGVRSALLFPAVHEGETLAVISFAGREPRALGDHLLQTLESLGGDLGRFLARRRAEIGPQALSNRELEVLGLAARGLSAPRIAERLAIGPATVKTHFTHIYEKLGVSDRSAAVAEAMRQGLID
jgi:PAS domain S-box-containing protein